MCPHLMFPYLVCFLSLFNVIISSFMSSRVCLIIYDLPVYISSCLFSLMSSGLLVIPGVSCLVVLIKYYHLSLYPRPRVPVPPSCVHRDIYKSLPFPAEILFYYFHTNYDYKGRWSIDLLSLTSLLYFTFSHLADTFIQSDLQIGKSN